jgi:hypothetical protein
MLMAKTHIEFHCNDCPLIVDVLLRSSVKYEIPFFVSIYRMSINSFPDYKYLLQEKYVEYKHIFFFQNVIQLNKFCIVIYSII